MTYVRHSLIILTLFGAALWFLSLNGRIEKTHLSSLSKRSLVSERFPVSLDNILKQDFAPSQWNGSWISDTEYSYLSSDGSVFVKSLYSGTSQMLIPASVMNKSPRVFKYSLSQDQKYALLISRPQRLFRHSFLATYEVYDIESGTRSLLAPSDDDEKVPRNLNDGDSSPPKPLLLAEWSPVGHGIAYVFDNNIYYRSSPFAFDKIITTSGTLGEIYNGICDWVYEEEVFGDTKALWFSPDGKYLSWVEFNDTSVDKMPITIYGRPGDLTFQYPISSPISYPKPGRTNPFVNVYAMELKSSTPFLLQPPKFFLDQEKIIYRVTWASSIEVSLTWENRHQNISIISICNMSSLHCSDSLVLSQPGGWLEMIQKPLFSNDSRQFAIISSLNNIKQVNIINRDRNERIPITSDKIVVLELLHWDEESHVIYYKGTGNESPGERHLYTVGDLTSDTPGKVNCLTCESLNPKGGKCGYNSISHSYQFSYIVVQCNGPNIPQDYLFSTKPSIKYIETLEENNKLYEDLKLINLPKVANLDIPVGEGGLFTAKVRLFLPSDFNENDKYPLLLKVYGGPDTQLINDEFKLSYETYLTTSENIIVAYIDGRGSGYRGDDYLFQIYYKMGVVEVEDQIEVMKTLLRKYSFIDSSKVAIWGWSYGGFVTTAVLASDMQSVFKCGVAVAPVTNWIYYDTIYTERYMGLPSLNDNYIGYKTADVTSKAKNFKNKKLLLIHGTADDNVHFQQSMMLTRSLEEADVIFQQLTYPDEAHGISSLRPHLYHSISHFLLNDCFQKN